MTLKIGLRVGNCTKLLICCLVLAGMAFAQTQIATVTSDSPFQLRGAGITPGQGVPSWPVMPGDTMQAGKTPLTITFPDGSTVVLAAGATAKADLAGQTPVFQLECGSAHYTLKTLSSPKLMKANHTVTPKDVVGDLTVVDCKLPVGWWTLGHTVAVVGGGAAATGLAVGIVETRPVSSSK
jgi:hypothetical protein